METNWLRLFVLAAEKRNISAAGRQLGMPPAVASTKLAKLETALGADLLHRSTRKVALSVEGAEFLPFAREILAQEDAALTALGHGCSTVTGTLRFTAPSTFAQMYIVPLLPEFMELYPHVHLDLHLSDVQLDLIEGSFDLALRNSPLVDSSIKGRKLADDQRVLCAAPRYLERNGIPHHPDDLKEHVLIALKDQEPRKLIGQSGEAGLFDPRAADCRLVINDGLSQKLATMAGGGISQNSLWSIHQELSDGTLVRVLPTYEVQDHSTLWLMYPQSNVLTAKVRVFMDFLLNRIGKSPSWLAVL